MSLVMQRFTHAAKHGSCEIVRLLPLVEKRSYMYNIIEQEPCFQWVNSSTTMRGLVTAAWQSSEESCRVGIQSLLTRVHLNSAGRVSVARRACVRNSARQHYAS